MAKSTDCGRVEKFEQEMPRHNNSLQPERKNLLEVWNVLPSFVATLP